MFTCACRLYFLSISFLLLMQDTVCAQTAMTNIAGRKVISLNGKWKMIIDAFDAGSGNWLAFYKDRKPSGNKDFVEYSFDDGPSLNVPGDFNSQLAELNYFESPVWYKKKFPYTKNSSKRLFIHFGAVNYKAEVYLNSVKIGEHEGGFTPFQFEITNVVKE